MTVQIKLTLLLVFTGTIISGYAKQTVYKYDGTEIALEKRWEWAQKTISQMKLTNEVWVGYSINRLMGKNSWIGAYSASDHRPTLRQILETGIIDDKTDDTEQHRFSMDGDGEEAVVKELAILFLKNGKSDQIHKVRLSNIDLPFQHKNLPIIWLGNMTQDASAKFVESLYQNTRELKVKEELITVLGNHNETNRAFEMLKKVLTSDEADEMRENAAFWLAQWNNAAALKVLEKVLKEDPSMKVRKKAVFSLYLINLPEATEILIDFAKNAEQGKIRKEAIFWLGQKASKKAVETLEEVAFNDEETEIQKQAVFALSQLPHQEGVPRLIKVAKTHPNPQTRKQAIFWLGQCDDERALDALIEFVRR